MSLAVASVPSGHVYVRHLSPVAHASGSAVVRLPDPPSGSSPDSPWWPPRMLTPEWIHEHFDDVPAEEMRLIVGGNAARIYQL